MDLRQRTTIATDPFATIKGIGSLTLRAEQYADLDAPSVARSVSVERTRQTLVNLSAQARAIDVELSMSNQHTITNHFLYHISSLFRHISEYFLTTCRTRAWFLNFFK